MALYEYDYNGPIPILRVRRLQNEWSDLITMGMGQNAWFTPEYFAWTTEEDQLPSPFEKDVDMPAGYKPPKFDIFDGTGDPHTHFRAYYDKLVGVGRYEKLRMNLFIRSLNGEALIWYTRHNPKNWREWQDMADDFMNRFRFNIEITLDRFALVNTKKKPSESFQEYAHRWRSEVTRAQPLLDDNELTKYFIRAQEEIYFAKMMGIMGQKFPS
nr:uncharacterized protein LOC117274296 [Nicotiana tomentosiformis]